MPKTLADTIFKIDPNSIDGGTPKFIAVSAKDLRLNEAWFRDSICKNPDLVILPCERLNLTDEQWYFWEKEFPVKTMDGLMVGKIDILLISESGRIAIVETKLAYNPEKRRNVLAQILDYAVHLQEMNPSDLPELPKDENGGLLAGYEEMAQHLSEGDLLLIVAGDNLDERAIKLSDALIGANMANPWNLAMVDLSLYKEEENGIFLLVPSIRKTVIAETRNVIKIAFDRDSSKTSVKIERVTSESKEEHSKINWDATSFFEKLESSNSSPQWKELGKQLYELSQSSENLTASFGTGKNGSLTLKRLKKSLIEFYINQMVKFRPWKFQPALGPELGAEYQKALKELFPKQMAAKYPQIGETDLLPKIQELVELIKSLVEKAER